MPINYRQDLQAQGQVQVQAVQSQSPGILRADTSSEQNKLGAAQAAGGMLGAWLSTKIEQGKAQDALAGATNKVVQDANASAREVVDAVAQGAAESAFPDAYKQGATMMAAQTVAQKSLHNAFSAVQTETSKASFKEWQDPQAFIRAQADAQRKLEAEYEALPGGTPEWLVKVKAAGIQSVEQAGSSYTKAYNERLVAETIAAKKADLHVGFVQQALKALKTPAPQQGPLWDQATQTLLASTPGLKAEIVDNLRKEAMGTLLFSVENGDFNPYERLKAYNVADRLGKLLGGGFARETAEKLRDTIRAENGTAANHELDRAVMAVKAGLPFEAPEGSIFYGVNIWDDAALRKATEQAYSTGRLSTAGYDRIMGNLDKLPRARLEAQGDPTKPKTFALLPDAQGNPQVTWNPRVLEALLLTGQTDKVLNDIQSAAYTGERPVSQFKMATNVYNQLSKPARGAFVGAFKDHVESWAKQQLSAINSGAVSGSTLLQEMKFIGPVMGLTAGAGPQYKELTKTIGLALAGIPEEDPKYLEKLDTNLTQNAQAKTAQADTVVGVAGVPKIVASKFDMPAGSMENRLISASAQQYAAMTGSNLSDSSAIKDAVGSVYIPGDAAIGSGTMLDPTVVVQLRDVRPRQILHATAQAMVSKAGIKDSDEANALLQTIRDGKGTIRLPNGTFAQVNTRIVYNGSGSSLEYKAEGDAWRPANLVVGRDDVLQGYKYIQNTPTGTVIHNVNGVPTSPPALGLLPEVVGGLKIPQNPHEQVALVGQLEARYGMQASGDAIAKGLVRIPKGQVASAQQTYTARAVADRLAAVGVLAAHTSANKTTIVKVQKEVLRLAQAPTAHPADIEKLASTLAKGDPQYTPYVRKWLINTVIPDVRRNALGLMRKHTK